MLRVGLTGGIACGKSTVAGWLRDMGLPVIDADAISRSLTAPGGEALPAIKAAFGPQVWLPNDTLDRKALAQIVFNDPQARERLNAILHPLVKQRMEAEMEACRKNSANLVILDVPLLYEAGMEDMADVVVCVSAPEDVQLARLKDRDGMDSAQALARIRSQWPLSKKQALAQETLWTNKPTEEVQADVTALYARLWERSQR